MIKNKQRIKVSQIRYLLGLFLVMARAFSRYLKIPPTPQTPYYLACSATPFKLKASKNKIKTSKNKQTGKLVGPMSFILTWFWLEKAKLVPDVLGIGQRDTWGDSWSKAVAPLRSTMNRNGVAIQGRCHWIIDVPISGCRKPDYGENHINLLTVNIKSNKTCSSRNISIPGKRSLFS